jgi:cytochrome bd ubiquinol oxidase subunit I
LTAAVHLARVQFALTIGYHFVFVPISIGLGLIMILAARRYRRSGLDSDRSAVDLWTRMFAATFAAGVATGLTMEFAFGTNWSGFSRFVGNIFGAPLAAEGLLSFFVESSFLGIVLFGKNRISSRAYYISIWVVFIAALDSAFWILVANSWMHTPAGFVVENGRAVLTNIWAAIFTKSLAPRFFHTVNATFMTGAFISAGVAAHYLLKKRHLDFAKRALTTALIVGTITSVAQPFIGHAQALEIAANQPVKMAAMEAIYQGGSHQPLSIYGWVNTGAQRAVSIKIPDGLSLILGLSPNHNVKGLDTVPAADRPNVQVLFQSWHLMIAVGILLALVMVIGLFLWWRGRLLFSLPYLKILRVMVPLPIVACILGWMNTEMGRQPWIVQGQLRTVDAVSPTVSTGEVATTLALLAVFYTGVLITWFYVVRGIVRKGPAPVAIGREEAAGPAPMTDQPVPAANVAAGTSPGTAPPRSPAQSPEGGRR